MPGEFEQTSDDASPPAHQRGADGPDLVFAALTHLRGSLPADHGASRTPTIARQKTDLREWAAGLGLLLNADGLPPKVVRGGQEHELFHDESTDRYFKLTRDGVFGLSPGIELALVSSSQDPRQFHLWEASPLEYLERLLLQNQLVPGLNILEGIIVQPDGDMAIVTSQPRFDLVPVTTAEIDAWFATLGFTKITEITGRSDLLERRTDLKGRPAQVDLKRFLRPDMALSVLEMNYEQVEPNRGICTPDGTSLNHRILAATLDAIDTAQDVSLVFKIKNSDRSVGGFY